MREKSGAPLSTLSVAALLKTSELSTDGDSGPLRAEVRTLRVAIVPSFLSGETETDFNARQQGFCDEYAVPGTRAFPGRQRAADQVRLPHIGQAVSPGRQCRRRSIVAALQGGQCCLRNVGRSASESCL